jgi:hypothetical protein
MNVKGKHFAGLEAPPIQMRGAENEGPGRFLKAARSARKHWRQSIQNRPERPAQHIPGLAFGKKYAFHCAKLEMLRAKPEK